MEGDVNTHKRWVLVGLGNPGLEYSETRHNIGKMVVSRLANNCNWVLKKESKLAVEAARGVFEGVNIHLVLPTTYMNETGRAVHRYIEYFRLEVQELIVVTDDVALPFGSFRLRLQGSAGGHNGLKSIEENVGTQNYVRLRIGIGQPPLGQDLADYVLDRFAREESVQLPNVLENGVQALRHIIHHSVEHSMNLLNTKDLKQES